MTDSVVQIPPAPLDEKGLLQATNVVEPKKRKTSAELKTAREAKCLGFISWLRAEKEIAASPDAEYRAAHWTAGGAIHIYLTEPLRLSARMRDAINEGRRRRPEQHRVLGFVENGVLRTYRDQQWHFHRKLKGLTFNYHILVNASKLGFEYVEIERANEETGRMQRLVKVSELLACPIVPRSNSGGYEVQILFKK